MQTSFVLGIATLFVFSCQQAPAPIAASEKAPFSEAAEKEAILKVIEDETSSFYKRDYEGWKGHFIQRDYAFQAWNNGDGSFDASVGWKDIDQRIGDYIKANPVTSGQASHPKVERKNLLIHFFSDSVAYLVWDQYNSDAAMKTYTLSKDQRIMEKENGAWKIVNVSSFWNYKSKVSADSLN
jgi:hypothetical protein